MHSTLHIPPGLCIETSSPQISLSPSAATRRSSISGSQNLVLLWKALRQTTRSPRSRSISPVLAQLLAQSLICLPSKFAAKRSTLVRTFFRLLLCFTNWQRGSFHSAARRRGLSSTRFSIELQSPHAD